MMHNIKLIAVIGMFLLLSACATPNPFDVSPENSVFLDNTYLNIDGAYYGYSFKAVDKDAKGKDFTSLRPGLIAAERDVTYTVPSGYMGLKILMIYGPDGVGAFKDLYYLWGYVKVDLKAGQRYRGRGKIYSDSALIWVEDENGQRVSDKVQPFLVTKAL